MSAFHHSSPLAPKEPMPRAPVTPFLLAVLCLPGCRRAEPLAAAGDVVVTAGWAYPSTAGMAGAYLVLENRGDRADTVWSLSGPEVGDASMHGVRREGVSSTMFPLEGLEVPPGGRVAMQPGGIHIMLAELSRELAVGDSLTLRLRLGRGGEAEVRLGVLPYGELPD